MKFACFKNRQTIITVTLLLNVGVHLRMDWRTSGVSFAQNAPWLACRSKNTSRDTPRPTSTSLMHLYISSKPKYTSAPVMWLEGVGGVISPMCTKVLKDGSQNR